MRGILHILIALSITSLSATNVWADAVTRRAAAQKKLSSAATKLLSDASAESKIDAFRSVVETDPNYADGRAAYGNALYAIGDYEGADVQFTWAVSLDPKSAAHKHSLGMTKLLVGQLTQAVGFLAEAVRLQPQNSEYRYGLLLSYIQVGRWERAIKLWKQGALKAAKTADQKAVTIILKAILDQEDEALGMAVSAQKQYPEKPVFAYLIGLIFEGQGRKEDAIRAYERSIKQYPENYDMHRILVMLYLESGYYRKAERLVKGYLSDPTLRKQMSTQDKVNAVYEVSNAQYQTGDYRAAKRSYIQYRKLFKKYKKRMGRQDKASRIGIDSLAHFANGVIEERKGQFKRAVTEYNLAIKGDPQFLLAYERLGQSYLMQSELTDLKKRPPLLRKARKVLEEALELKRDNPAIYLLLGNATYQLALIEKGQFRTGLLREALFLFGQADIGLRDKYAVRVFQGKISDSLGEYRQALKYYEDANSFRKKDPQVLLMMGHTNMKLRQYESAVTAYLDSANAGADERDTALGIALAYERMNDPGLADFWHDNAEYAARGGKWTERGKVKGLAADEELNADGAVEKSKPVTATSQPAPATAVTQGMPTTAPTDATDATESIDSAGDLDSELEN